MSQIRSHGRSLSDNIQRMWPATIVVMGFVVSVVWGMALAWVLIKAIYYVV
jgi:hypothetical protein